MCHDADEGGDRCYLTTVGRRTARPHTIGIWFVLRGVTLYMLSGGGSGSDWVLNLIENARGVRPDRSRAVLRHREARHRAGRGPDRPGPAVRQVPSQLRRGPIKEAGSSDAGCRGPRPVTLVCLRTHRESLPGDQPAKHLFTSSSNTRSGGG